jgi:hypothetical protein
MYNSEKNSAQELREMVAFMEKMRVEAMKDKATQVDVSREYNIKTLMKNHSAFDDWVQGYKQGIQWYANRPMRWARNLLTSNNAMILTFDTTSRLVITRILVTDMHEKIIYDTYVKPETTMGGDNDNISGAKDQVYSRPLPSDEAWVPSLPEAWAPLRDIMMEARNQYSSMIGDPPIVSYDVNLHKSIIASHAHYFPKLQHDYMWNELGQRINFIEEAMLYFGDYSVMEEEHALAVFCQKIAHPFPPPAQQTAEVRAIAQLRVLHAMAQGIGAKDMFAEED